MTLEMETRTDIPAYIDDLKKILTDLRDTGDDGFEGLIRTVLSEIAGVPFRLAGSGSQFGVDGKSTYADDGISFECKCYKDKVSRAAIMSKIGELAIGGSDTDLGCYVRHLRFVVKLLTMCLNLTRTRQYPP